MIDPNADQDIQERFYLELDHRQGGGAILYAKTTFDREQKKEYQVPVIVGDAGYPSLSATCLVTVSIADLNDNFDMKDGWKNVQVYFVNELPTRKSTNNSQ